MPTLHEVSWWPVDFVVALLLLPLLLSLLLLLLLLPERRVLNVSLLFTFLSFFCFCQLLLATVFTLSLLPHSFSNFIFIWYDIIHKLTPRVKNKSHEWSCFATANKCRDSLFTPFMAYFCIKAHSQWSHQTCFAIQLLTLRSFNFIHTTDTRLHE